MYNMKIELNGVKRQESDFNNAKELHNELKRKYIEHLINTDGDIGIFIHKG